MRRYLLFIITAILYLPLLHAQTKWEKKAMRESDKLRTQQLRQLDKKERRAGQLHLWWGGFPSPREYRIVQDSIGRRYGCGFTGVSGCIRSPKESNFQDKHNKKVMHILNRLNGDAWRERMYRETDSVFNLYTRVLDSFGRSISFFKQHEQLMDSLVLNVPLFRYRVWPSSHPDTLLIKAFEMDERTHEWKTDRVIFDVLAVPSQNRFFLKGRLPEPMMKPEDAATVKN